MVAAVGFGLALNNLLDGISKVIEDAGNVGNDLLIEAGNQARRTIVQVQLAYADSLNMTVDKIGVEAQRILHDVEMLANGVINKQDRLIQNATKSAMMILNMLPLTSDVPQLLSVSPRFVSVPAPLDADHKVQITFQGNFRKAMDPKFYPALKFPNGEYAPTATTIARLDFEVPFDAILDRKIISKIGPSSLGELVIPYKFEGGLLGVGQTLKSAVYKVFLRSLPPSPGTISLKLTTKHHKRDVQYLEKGRYAAYVTPGYYDQSWHLCSCSTQDCINTGGHQPADSQFRGRNNDEERSFNFDPTPGWSIIPSTSGYRLEVLQGDVGSPSRTRDSADGVTYKVRTEHHGMGTSASVNVNIYFKQEKYFDDLVKDKVDVPLKWGTTTSYTPAQLKDPCTDNCVPNRCTPAWKVVFTDFRGNKNKFVASVDSAYLKIENVNGLSISAPRASDLDELK